VLILNEIVGSGERTVRSEGGRERG